MDRLEFLNKKHRELDAEIKKLESLTPGARNPNHDELVAQMKKTKLKIKDEMRDLSRYQRPYRE